MAKTKQNALNGIRYRTSGNYDPSVLFGREYEENTLESCTVPDQSLTVQQLLDRHQRGQVLRGYKPVYYDDVHVPMIETMDFAEKRAFLEHIKEHREAIEEYFAKTQDEIAQKKQQEEIDALVEEQLKLRLDNPPE